MLLADVLDESDHFERGLVLPVWIHLPRGISLRENLADHGFINKDGARVFPHLPLAGKTPLEEPDPIASK